MTELSAERIAELLDRVYVAGKNEGITEANGGAERDWLERKRQGNTVKAEVAGALATQASRPVMGVTEAMVEKAARAITHRHFAAAFSGDALERVVDQSWKESWYLGPARTALTAALHPDTAAPAEAVAFMVSWTNFGDAERTTLWHDRNSAQAEAIKYGETVTPLFVAGERERALEEALMQAPNVNDFYERDATGQTTGFDRTRYVIAWVDWIDIRDAAIQGRRVALATKPAAKEGEKALEVWRDCFAEITAKATPYGSDPDNITAYIIPAGPLHRAAGKTGFQFFGGEEAAKEWQARAERFKTAFDEYVTAMKETVIPEIEAAIQRRQTLAAGPERHQPLFSATKPAP